MHRLARSITTLLVTSLLCTSPLLYAKSADKERAEIRQTRDEVLAELYKLEPKAKEKIEKAEGYAVFTNIGVNVIIASAAGGHGIVVKKGTPDKEVFMKMGSVGVGIGLGVKDFRAIFVFTDEEKLDGFIEHGWDFSGQADAAAKSDDKGAAAATAGDIAKGVEVYQITKSGLALQATLQGTKYWKDDDLN